MIKSTIDLAHALGMTVVAEGVETKETLGILLTIGADTAQGYYISRPKTRQDLVELLATEREQSRKLNKTA